MFSNSTIEIEKYLGWFERIIDMILKLFGMSNTTTTAPATTAAAEVEGE